MKSSKSKTPQLRVTERKTSDLIGYVLNAKDHPPEQVAALAGIIREVGFRSPIAIDEAGVIIAGHGRLLAAQKLGMTEVPCIVHVDLTEREKRILRIADNKLAEMAVVNQGNLSEELRDLAAMGEDFALTGYTQADVDALTKAADELGDLGDIPDESKPADKLTECPKCGFRWEP